MIVDDIIKKNGIDKNKVIIMAQDEGLKSASL